MDITFSSIVIITEKFEVLTSFYKDTLLQEIQDDFGNCIMFKGGFSIWQLTDEYTIAKHLGRTFHKSGNKNIEICFESDTFAEVLESLKTKDIEYLHEAKEEMWGQKTVRFYDPEKNLVEIGESIPCFVKRFYESGMTFEEVAKRTSVPVEAVIKMCE